MIEFEKTKSLPITKEMVWEAYLQVRRKGKSAGVDSLSMSQYDLQRHRHLYKVWNRLASGSYFPPPVLQVEIPKKNGSIRQLGIPTISDRVAQTVIKNQIEERLEKIFHPQSYGYRPKRSAHQALDQVRKNCWKYDWVIDLDIKNFFDDIDHDKLLKALGKHVEEKWVLRYIERWLKAPLQTRKGEIIARANGTPQGGVISPLLANLFLHYTLDVWLGRLNPSIEFVRYADDIIIHGSTQSQAEQNLQKIKERVEYCGLTLHPDKTKIVYCKDFRRQQKYKKVKFDFLGYTFQPRTSKSKKTGKLFLGFDCAISIQSRSRIFEQIRKMEIPRMRCDSITGIAHHLNPKLRGWIRYFGKYRGYSLSKVFYILRIKLVRWARYRYKRYRNNLMKAYKWLDRVREQYPSLFYHWYIGYSN
ncbi:group II intron reverse transcriptase/maturase [Gelidibacter japonicus]|uniref:group II intron reverse transcriptase/maturase n=1 Tax=Gelidibacter japonicus TaxID=1962232 RepID=UPI002021F96C|nr:group II intron reverse transcriptase/maturase [Gelidibacter japonicus]MCL8009368.1 group II intron reverse transcriptase/maturase [Gelidibacter japonicus]